MDWWPEKSLSRIPVMFCIYRFPSKTNRSISCVLELEPKVFKTRYLPELLSITFTYQPALIRFLTHKHTLKAHFFASGTPKIQNKKPQAAYFLIITVLSQFFCGKQEEQSARFSL